MLRRRRTDASWCKVEIGLRLSVAEDDLLGFRVEKSWIQWKLGKGEPENDGKIPVPHFSMALCVA